MQLTIELFAGARQAAGDRATVAVELAPPITASDVMRAIADQVPELASMTERSRLAVNDDYVASERRIEPSDRIALIPPVSGG